MLLCGCSLLHVVQMAIEVYTWVAEILCRLVSEGMVVLVPMNKKEKSTSRLCKMQQPDLFYSGI